MPNVMLSAVRIGAAIPTGAGRVRVGPDPLGLRARDRGGGRHVGGRSRLRGV